MTVNTKKRTIISAFSHPVSVAARQRQTIGSANTGLIPRINFGHFQRLMQTVSVCFRPRTRQLARTCGGGGGKGEGRGGEGTKREGWRRGGGRRIGGERLKRNAEQPGLKVSPHHVRRMNKRWLPGDISRCFCEKQEINVPVHTAGSTRLL